MGMIFVLTGRCIQGTASGQQVVGQENVATRCDVLRFPFFSRINPNTLDFPHGAPAITRREINFANSQGVVGHLLQLTIYKTILSSLIYGEESFICKTYIVWLFVLMFY